jgi:hypothetical protein
MQEDEQTRNEFVRTDGKAVQLDQLSGQNKDMDKK